MRRRIRSGCENENDNKNKHRKCLFKCIERGWLSVTNTATVLSPGTVIQNDQNLVEFFCFCLQCPYCWFFVWGLCHNICARSDHLIVFEEAIVHTVLNERREYNSRLMQTQSISSKSAWLELSRKSLNEYPKVFQEFRFFPSFFSYFVSVHC